MNKPATYGFLPSALLACAAMGMGGCAYLTEEDAEQGIAMVTSEIAGTIGTSDIEKPCLDGGYVQVHPTLSWREASVEYGFSECTNGDIRVYGRFQAGISVGLSGASASIQGELDFYGSINGFCIIDVGASIGPFSGPRFSGKVCDFQSPELRAALLSPMLDDLRDLIGL